MKLVLDLPEGPLEDAKVPRHRMEAELKLQLAAALYRGGILGGAGACRLAGVGKAEFQFWLGEHGIPQSLEPADFERELEGLRRWQKNV